MKLISMTDFVLEQNKILNKYTNHEKAPLFDKLTNYANFLKQPLKLEMFVPKINEPSVDAYMQPRAMQKQYDEWFQEYGKKVLFKGFKLVEELEFVYKFKHRGKEFNVLKHDLPIEWLVGDDIELTQNAIKQLGL